jgi:predicted ATPase
MPSPTACTSSASKTCATPGSSPRRSLTHSVWRNGATHRWPRPCRRISGRGAFCPADNFEVVDEAAPLLSELLKAAPDLALLVTSRTPLRLSGEHEHRVPPMTLTDATRLSARRARAVAPGFRRPSEEAEAMQAFAEKHLGTSRARRSAGRRAGQ